MDKQKMRKDDVKSPQAAPGPKKRTASVWKLFQEWTQRGMIPRPSDYESAALTN